MDHRNERPGLIYLHQSEMTTSSPAETTVSNTSPVYTTINHYHNSCEISGQHRWNDCPFTATTSDNRKCSHHKKISNEINIGQDRDYNEEHFEKYVTEKLSNTHQWKKIKRTEKDINTLKLVLTRKKGTDQFKSQLKSTLKNYKGNASNTVTETESMKVVCEEPTKSVSCSNSKIGKIRCRDSKTMFEEHMYRIYMENFFNKKPIVPLTKVKKAIIVPNNSINGIYSTEIRGNVLIYEIEKLYNKYFKKPIQDSIVIIANISNIIIIFNKHYKSQMDKFFTEPNSAEKQNERWNAKNLHSMRTNNLETKLKEHFMYIVSSIADTDFELTIQMVFLSILIIFLVLDHPKFNITNLFKMLVYLLNKSLKNSEFEYPKFYSITTSDSFSSECYGLLNLIENSRGKDPAITDRMAFFFVSKVNGQEFFKTVINAINSDSNEDMKLLIKNAELQYYANSTFKDSLNYSSSIIKKCVTNNTPVTTVSNTARLDDEDKHLVIAANGINQPILMRTNETNLQKTINMNLQSTSANLPLYTYYETLPNLSLTRVYSELDTTIKIESIFVTPPSVASTSLDQTTTLYPFKQTIHKQYIFTEGPMSQFKEMPMTHNANNNVIESEPSPLNDHTLKCFASNCQNSATIICSSCISAQYCSYNCQKLDWYDFHKNNCCEQQQYT